MVTTENIGYSINGKILLDKVSLTLHPNEITMVIGPNGAGKSTFIKLLSQQMPCTTGQVRFEEKNIKSMDKADMARIRAVLSQSIEMVFPLTVEQVIMMGRYPHFKSQPTQTDRDICQKAINFFNVATLVNRNYLTLSGGEKQRVHFARVAAQIWPDKNETTKYLLLDEPLTYLDVYYQYEFMRLLKKLMSLQSMVVVGVVHDLNLAYRYGNQVVLLHNGTVLASGTRETVFTPENILTAFKVDAHILTDNKGNKFFSL